MEKFWLFGKKSEPAEDVDDTYDDWYYQKNSDGSEDSDGGNGYYNDEDGISDISVVLDNASATASDEPLLKRIFTPAQFTDGSKIVDCLKDGRVAVIYVEELDKENFVRLFDYLMGAVRALDCELRRYDRETVVILPYDVDEEISLDELEEEILPDDIDADGSDSE